jgi:hypothetical protein
MLIRVTLVRTDISEKSSASIIGVTRIGELGTTLAVTSKLLTLWRNAMKMEVLRSSETPFLTCTTLRNIPEDGILQGGCVQIFRTYFFKIRNFPSTAVSPVWLIFPQDSLPIKLKSEFPSKNLLYRCVV